MFEDILIEQAFFFLHIRGQNLFVSTVRSKLRTAFFLTLEAFMGVLMVMGMFQQSDDLYALLENVTALTTLFQATVKSIVLILRKDDFLNGIAVLKKFWPTDMFGTKSGKEISNYGRCIKNVLRIFRLVVGVSATLYLMKPLFEEERMLPITCYICCKLEDDVCYISYYLLQAAALYSQLIALIGFDGVFFTLLMSGYAELEQIKYALGDLEINEDAEGDEDKLLKKAIVLIDHHSLVLEYIDKFNKLFRTALLAQYGASIFSLCSSLFIMTINGFPPSTGEFLKGGPYGFSAVSQILIYSAIGEKIAEQTESISDVAYDTNWSANYQPKFRKMLLMIMQRAQKRSQITAGGVWNLNMSTFASILKGSMSLLAFMQTVYGDKKEQTNFNY